MPGFELAALLELHVDGSHGYQCGRDTESQFPLPVREEADHVGAGSDLLRQALDLLPGQARVQLPSHVFDPVDQRVHTLYRCVDKELKADFLHDNLFVVREIRHPVVQL